MGESSGCREYVGGLVVGISTVITGHSFDIVKVKLQKHNTEPHGITYMNGGSNPQGQAGGVGPAHKARTVPKPKDKGWAGSGRPRGPGRGSSRATCAYQRMEDKIV